MKRCNGVNGRLADVQGAEPERRTNHLQLKAAKSTPKSAIEKSSKPQDCAIANHSDTALSCLATLATVHQPMLVTTWVMTSEFDRWVRIKRVEILLKHLILIRTLRDSDLNQRSGFATPANA